MRPDAFDIKGDAEWDWRWAEEVARAHTTAKEATIVGITKGHKSDNNVFQHKYRAEQNSAQKAKPNNPALVKLWPWIRRSQTASSPGAAMTIPEGEEGRRQYLSEVDFKSCNN